MNSIHPSLCFIVCTETIRDIIRPLILAVPLAAKITAGHVLLILLGINYKTHNHKVNYFNSNPHSITHFTRRTTQGLLLTIILRIYFTTLQACEYIEASFTTPDSLYVCLIWHIIFYFSSNHYFRFEAAALTIRRYFNLLMRNCLIMPAIIIQLLLIHLSIQTIKINILHHNLTSRSKP
ncbi:Cytochrome c oxidase subunit 3 [Gryllus bimaculatus]|nr:Cytochrome c oxidase subunit 3 [Gryllus bimaculatus]